MNDTGLTNMGDAAVKFGVHRTTIRDIVRTHNLPTHPMSNGNARGLDRKTMARIGKILAVKARPLSAA